MPKRHLVKSCCGSTAYVLELDSPIMKQDLKTFQQSGYATSDIYTRVGVFYVEKQGLIASGSFGGNRLQIRIANANASQQMDDLENTFSLSKMIK